MIRILVPVFVVALAGTAAAQEAPQIEKGKQVYAAQKCQVCHAIAGVGNRKGALDDVGARLKRDEIRQWIIAPSEMAAKTKAERKPPMKAYPNLANDDLDALVAYLAGLKKKAG